MVNNGNGGVTLEEIGTSKGKAKERVVSAVSFLRDLLALVGVTGAFKLQLMSSETGKSERQGLHGMHVQLGKQPYELHIRLQLGSNDTCGKFCLYVPPGIDAKVLRDKLLALRDQRVKPLSKLATAEPAAVVVRGPEPTNDTPVRVSTPQLASATDASAASTSKQAVVEVVPLPKKLSSEAAVVLCAMYVRKDGRDFPARGNNFWSNVPAEQQKAIRYEARDVGLMEWDNAQTLNIVYHWGAPCPTLFQAALMIYQLVDGESPLRRDVVSAIEQDYPAKIIHDALGILTNPMHRLLVEEMATGTLSRWEKKSAGPVVVTKAAVTKPKRTAAQKKVETVPDFAVSVADTKVAETLVSATPVVGVEIRQLQDNIAQVADKRTQLRELISKLSEQAVELETEHTALCAKLAAKQREHEDFLRTTERLEALLSGLNPEMRELALKFVASPANRK